MKTLAGLTSPCVTPRACACASASPMARGDANGIPVRKSGGRAAAEDRAERLARQVFHDDEPGAAIAIDVEETDDIRVHDGLCLAELALQARDAGRPGSQLRAQQLDRDAAAIRGGCVAAQVNRPPDRCGAAVADLGLEHIAVAQHVLAARTALRLHRSPARPPAPQPAAAAPQRGAWREFARDLVREVLGRVGTDGHGRVDLQQLAGKLRKRVVDVRAHALVNAPWPDRQYALSASLSKRSP